VKKYETSNQFRREVIQSLSAFTRLPPLLFRWLSEHSPYHENAPVKTDFDTASHKGKLPLVLFSHGLSGTLDMYSVLCASLAAEGYIVAALEHEDGSALFAQTASGHVVPPRRPPKGFSYTRGNCSAFRKPFLDMRVEEIRQVWQKLKSLGPGSASGSLSTGAGLSSDATKQALDGVAECINFDQVFLCGHSFGGATVVRAAQDLPMMSADSTLGTMVLDMWPYCLPAEVTSAGLGIHPSLFLNSEPFATNSEAHICKDLVKTSQAALGLYLPGSVHGSFSDTPIVLPRWLGKLLRLTGQLDSDVAYSEIAGACLLFMDECRRGVRVPKKKKKKSKKSESNDTQQADADGGLLEISEVRSKICERHAHLRVME
jgi:dienelactone hydrolase